MGTRVSPLRITGSSVAAYRIPTEAPQSDGTYEWDSSTLVTVGLRAGDVEGLGYTYADKATAALLHDRLLPLAHDASAFDIALLIERLVRAVRNLGRGGIASLAISAVDTALWDLKAKLLGTSLADLLGVVRDAIPVYGSGGFTSYSPKALREQLGQWADAGFPFVKMQVGRTPSQDVERVDAARAAIGARAHLFVDADGAYTRTQALQLAEAFDARRVAWFEEPVPSDDLDGLRLLRDRAPGTMAIAAGEYGCDLAYFRRMLDAHAVDVLQADATRCGGITGFMAVAALADAYAVPLSSHGAPSLHVAPACAASRAIHLEYVHDHARVERMLFDGFREPAAGTLGPDRSRPGLGLELKRADAERFRL